MVKLVNENGCNNCSSSGEGMAESPENVGIKKGLNRNSAP
jgi:hypothetical protein